MIDRNKDYKRVPVIAVIRVPNYLSENNKKREQEKFIANEMFKIFSQHNFDENKMYKFEIGYYDA